jgi:gluconokinase
MILILLGVSGAGKLKIGYLLSCRLGWSSPGGNDYQSEANRRKMEFGNPLIEEEREPWPNFPHLRKQEFIGCKDDGVVACSALEQKYRDLLFAGLTSDRVRFRLLDARAICSKNASANGAIST